MLIKKIDPKDPEIDLKMKEERDEAINRATELQDSIDEVS